MPPADHRPRTSTRIECGEIDQGFGESRSFPIGRSPQGVLIEVERERVGFNLLLDGTNVQVFGMAPVFCQIEEVINRFHRSGSERLPRRKLCGLIFAAELGGIELAVTREAIKNIGEKLRGQVVLDLGI